MHQPLHFKFRRFHAPVPDSAARERHASPPDCPRWLAGLIDGAGQLCQPPFWPARDTRMFRRRAALLPGRPTPVFYGWPGGGAGGAAQGSGDTKNRRTGCGGRCRAQQERLV